MREWVFLGPYTQFPIVYYLQPLRIVTSLYLFYRCYDCCYGVLLSLIRKKLTFTQT